MTGLYITYWLVIVLANMTDMKKASNKLFTSLLFHGKEPVKNNLIEAPMIAKIELYKMTYILA